MPFDPNIPQEHTDLDAAQMRAQFNALHQATSDVAGTGATSLAAAIATTSANSNGVATVDTPFTNDPPTLADMEAMRAKFNELVAALRR